MTKDYDYTIYNQYANSKKLLDVIMSFAEASSLDNFTDEFIEKVWDILTCNSFGLDIWGKKVGAKRFVIPVIPENNIFGFSEAVDNNPAILNYPKPFNAAPFYDEDTMLSRVVGLNDDQYRALILAKAFTNISIATLPEINRFLRIFLLNRPTAHAYDTRNFQIVVKTPYIDRFELSLLFNYPEASPVSSCVDLRVDITDTPGGGIRLERVIFVPDILTIPDEDNSGSATYSLFPANATDDYLFTVPDAHQSDVTIDKNAKTVSVKRNPLTPDDYTITVTNVANEKQVGALRIVFNSYIPVTTFTFDPPAVNVAPTIARTVVDYTYAPDDANEPILFDIPDAQKAYVIVNTLTQKLTISRNTAALSYEIKVTGANSGKLLATLPVAFAAYVPISAITFTPQTVDVPIGTNTFDITYAVAPDSPTEDYTFTTPIVNAGDIAVDKNAKKITVTRNDSYPQYTITAKGLASDEVVGSVAVKFEQPDVIVGIIFDPDEIDVPWGTDSIEVTYKIYPETTQESYTFTVPDANKNDVTIDKDAKKLTIKRNNAASQYTITVSGDITKREVGSLPVIFELPILVESVTFTPEPLVVPIGVDTGEATYTYTPEDAQEPLYFEVPVGNQGDLTVDTANKKITFKRNPDPKLTTYTVNAKGTVSGEVIARMHVTFEIPSGINEVKFTPDSAVAKADTDTISVSYDILKSEDGDGDTNLSLDDKIYFECPDIVKDSVTVDTENRKITFKKVDYFRAFYFEAKLKENNETVGSILVQFKDAPPKLGNRPIMKIGPAGGKTVIRIGNPTNIPTERAFYCSFPVVGVLNLTNGTCDVFDANRKYLADDGYYISSYRILTNTGAWATGSTITPYENDDGGPK